MAYFFDGIKKWVTPSDPMPTVLKNSSVGVSSVAMPETLRNGKVTVDTAGTAVQLSATSVALLSGVIVKAAVGNSSVGPTPPNASRCAWGSGVTTCQQDDRAS